MNPNRGIATGLARRTSGARVAKASAAKVWLFERMAPAKVETIESIRQAAGRVGIPQAVLIMALHALCEYADAKLETVRLKDGWK